MLNTRIRLAAALLISSMTPALLADVIELEGTVTAVDAKERTITIKKKTLEIAKKCRITVGGEDADFDDLKPDQEVTVEYDDDLDVAKSISVAGNDGKAVDADLKAMQGQWTVIAAEEGGKVLDDQAMRRQNRRMTIDDNEMIVERVGGAGRVGTYKGRFVINESRKTFDWIGLDYQGRPVEWNGIYSLDGDTLKVCYRYRNEGSPSRPRTFKSDDNGKHSLVFYTFKRDK